MRRVWLTQLLALLFVAVGCSGSEAEEAPLAQVAPSPAASPTVAAPTATARPTATATPAPTATSLPNVPPGEILVSPAGDLAAGDQVTLRIQPHENFDIYNTWALFCARVDGGDEYCDPRPLPSTPAARSAESISMGVTVPRFHFGPTGYRDCATAGVDCRFLIKNSTGLAASGPLSYTDAPSGSFRPAIELVIDHVEAGTNRFQLTLPGDQLAGLEDDVRNGMEATARDALGGEQFRPELMSFAWAIGSVCAFDAGDPPLGSETLAEAPPWWNILDWSSQDQTPDGGTPLTSTNCDWNAVTAPEQILDLTKPIEVEILRTIYGYRGWSDCASAPCFISLQARWLYPSDNGGMVGNDEAVAYALIPTDLDWPEPAAPTIAIVEPPPYRGGDTVTVEANNLRVDDDFALSFCFGTQQCVYGGSSRTETRASMTWTIPTSGCEGNRCYFAPNSGGEGLPPPVIAVIPIG